MKHKICKGKIYVTTMPILGVLKHFVEDFRLQFVCLIGGGGFVTRGSSKF